MEYSYDHPHVAAERVECLVAKKEIEIERLASDGAGVGYIDGKATFVPGMLPGEKGTVRITEEKKSYQRGDVITIFNPSPQRQTPPCPVYQECGGCNLQHMKYEYTLHWKRQWVEDALRRIGGLRNIIVEPVLGLEEPWRYRNKAVLHRDREGRFGYYRPKTNDVVPFADCLLLSESTNRRIRKLQQTIVTSCPDIKTATVRESSNGKGLILLEGDLPEPSIIHTLTKDEDFSPSVCSITYPRGKMDFAGSGTPYLNEYLDDICFRVSPRAFLQVNPIQTRKLYSLILEYAKLKGTEEVWDLYCGIGTITLLLAKRAQKVVGIEENPYAVEDAVYNARENKITNVNFLQGKVEETLKNKGRIEGDIGRIAGTPDIVVTDPPRAGMDPLVVQKLRQIKPEKIIYVSCNPATLARDLKMLVSGEVGNDGGRGSKKRENTADRGIYVVEKVQPVDFFPWTSHVECVELMTRL
ncbi:MAG TPA: class I SAM-dependent RNA methyltransferase [Peptococcaceae bacterium]|nr:class I SAM-dependent RNA methyltransferase [Peptococcaceae bacterium]